MNTTDAAVEALRARIDPARIPMHVAIIMDGNGRWARSQGEHRIVGHTRGTRSVREALVGATQIGVRFLTLYAFSTENWNRPREEVLALMDLLVRTLAGELESLNENGVRLNAIGDLDSLPAECRNTLEQAMQRTADNQRITLTLALSYSARWEITRAMKGIAREVHAGTIAPEQISEQLIAARLATAGMPDPELLIRTSGEHRISNFLLWQIAYAELYFTTKLWPEFTKADLFEAILDYQSRERRFGLISEQVAPS